MKNSILKPGRKILTTDGKILLIGDVNKSLGQCDCCGFSRSNIEAILDENDNTIETTWSIDEYDTEGSFDEYFGNIKAISKTEAINYVFKVEND